MPVKKVLETFIQNSLLLTSTTLYGWAEAGVILCLFLEETRLREFKRLIHHMLVVSRARIGSLLSFCYSPAPIHPEGATHLPREQTGAGTLNSHVTWDPQTFLTSGQIITKNPGREVKGRMEASE